MKLLCLCVANSARSQMAEGLARAFHGVDVQSAGSHPTHVKSPCGRGSWPSWGSTFPAPSPPRWTPLIPMTVDTVITLCAEEECPVFLGKAKRLHWPLPDPAEVEGSMTTSSASRFARTRDEIRRLLAELIGPGDAFTRVNAQLEQNAFPRGNSAPPHFLHQLFRGWLVFLVHRCTKKRTIGELNPDVANPHRAPR